MMKERLLEILQNEYSALDVMTIADKLGLKTPEEVSNLQTVLEECQKEFTVYLTKKNKYILYVNCPNFRKGVISVNKKGFGFLINTTPGEEDIHISADNLNKALDDDYVLVEVIDESKWEGKVISILKRDKKNIVGEIKNEKGKLYFAPLDPRAGLVKVPQDQIDNCVEGEIVCVKLSSDLKKCNADIVEHLGHKDDAGMDVLAECAKYDIFDKFPDEAMQQTEEIPTEVEEKDRVGRKDLTNEMIFTIDGADTKDIDDAISLEVKDGYYYLGVHIADVSYYVTEGSPLDKEALRRGTSTYPANYVIPQLPHKLSNGICSLNEGVDRCAISCVMKIDSRGRTVSSDVFPSIIRSNKKMTYTNVNEIIEKDNIPEGYEPFAETLKSMQELAHIIRNDRTRRGASDFDIDESKVVCDENGKPIEISTRVRGEGERLIEDFMIAANEAVATTIYYMQLPGIYRVHDVPNEEKLQDFIHFCELNGQHLTGMKTVNPREYQKLLNQLHVDDDKLAQIFKSKAVRAMAKAVYSTDNIGHFGLASKCYTHFTSPIRRYPDLETHRLLRTYLFEHKLDERTINYYGSHLDEICQQSSDREQASAKAEREVNKMKMAEYMEDHIGEEFQVMVTDVTGTGMFCAIDNGIEGFVPVQSLKGDYFEYVEDLMCLMGKSTKKRYSIGDRLFVKCTRASKEDKQIDFELVKDLELDNNQEELEDAKKLTLNNGRSKK